MFFLVAFPLFIFTALIETALIISMGEGVPRSLVGPGNVEEFQKKHYENVYE